MQDTIVAQATPVGHAGVGVVRISGKEALKVAQTILGITPKSRFAHYLEFKDLQGEVLDKGIALFFKAPNSFTGEDVLELQGHGGQIVLDLLIAEILKLPNLRLARAGEFTERAFLNNKIDLTQAEAIADLIEATSEQAARGAMLSLQGEFSKQIEKLTDKVIYLRTFIEASIDFPEEEVEIFADGKIQNSLLELINEIKQIITKAQTGAILKEGIKLVIIGSPNAGKSSLLNALAQNEIAIVTDIAGTTRDVVREVINLDGIPLHISDTAGLHETNDKVEQIGIAKAYDEIAKAEQIVLLQDATQGVEPNKELLAKLPKNIALTVVLNKIDLLKQQPTEFTKDNIHYICISAKENLGLDILKNRLKQNAGITQSTEGNFIARRRHLTALTKALEHLQNSEFQLTEFLALELVAEELRLSQIALDEITGRFSADDLLGQIFGSFCIGK